MLQASQPSSDYYDGNNIKSDCLSLTHSSTVVQEIFIWKNTFSALLKYAMVTAQSTSEPRYTLRVQNNASCYYCYIVTWRVSVYVSLSKLRHLVPCTFVSFSQSFIFIPQQDEISSFEICNSRVPKWSKSVGPLFISGRYVVNIFLEVSVDCRKAICRQETQGRGVSWEQKPMIPPH